MLRLVLNSADLFCHSACKNEGWDNLKGCHSNPVFRGPRGEPVGLADIRLDTEVQQREVRCPRAVARTAGVHPPSPLSRLCRRINLQHQGAKNSPESSLNTARSHWLQKWSFTSPRPIFRNVQTPADVSSRCCLSARVPVRFPPSPIPPLPSPTPYFQAKLPKGGRQALQLCAWCPTGLRVLRPWKVSWASTALFPVQLCREFPLGNIDKCAHSWLTSKHVEVLAVVEFWLNKDGLQLAMMGSGGQRVHPSPLVPFFL